MQTYNLTQLVKLYTLIMPQISEDLKPDHCPVSFFKKVISRSFSMHNCTINLKKEYSIQLDIEDLENLQNNPDNCTVDYREFAKQIMVFFWVYVEQAPNFNQAIIEFNDAIYEICQGWEQIDSQSSEISEEEILSKLRLQKEDSEDGEESVYSMLDLQGQSKEGKFTLKMVRILQENMITCASTFFYGILEKSDFSNQTPSLLKDQEFLKKTVQIMNYSPQKEWLDFSRVSIKPHNFNRIERSSNGKKLIIETAFELLTKKCEDLKTLLASEFDQKDKASIFECYYDSKSQLHSVNRSFGIIKCSICFEQIVQLCDFIEALLGDHTCLQINLSIEGLLQVCLKQFYVILEFYTDVMITKLNMDRIRAQKNIALKFLSDSFPPQESENKMSKAKGILVLNCLEEFEQIESQRCPINGIFRVIKSLLESVIGSRHLDSEKFFKRMGRIGRYWTSVIRPSTSKMDLNPLKSRRESKFEELSPLEKMDFTLSTFNLIFQIFRFENPTPQFYYSMFNHSIFECVCSGASILLKTCLQYTNLKRNEFIEEKALIFNEKILKNSKSDDNFGISFEDLLTIKMIESKLSLSLKFIYLLDSTISSNPNKGKLSINTEKGGKRISQNISSKEARDYYRAIRLYNFECISKLLIDCYDYSLQSPESIGIQNQELKTRHLNKRRDVLIEEEVFLNFIMINFRSVNNQILKTLGEFCVALICEGIEQPFNSIVQKKNSKKEKKYQEQMNNNKERLRELGFSDRMIDRAIVMVSEPIILEELFEWLIANSNNDEESISNPSSSQKQLDSLQEAKEGLQLQEGEDKKETSEDLREIISYDKRHRLQALKQRKGEELLYEKFRSFCIDIFKRAAFLEGKNNFSLIVKRYFFATHPLGNKEFESIFLFELYYLYVDTATLILNSFVRARLQNVGYFGDFSVRMPERISRKKEDWGIQKKVLLDVKCRAYDQVQSPSQRIFYLIKDSMILMRRMSDLLNLAGSNKWTPSGTSELSFLLNFKSEMINLLKVAFTEKRVFNLVKLVPIISSLFEEIYLLFNNLLKIQPKISKGDTLASKRLQKLSSVKSAMCLRLLKSSYSLLEISSQIFEEYSINVFTITTLSSLLDVLSTSFEVCPAMRKHFIKQEYLQKLLSYNQLSFLKQSQKMKAKKILKTSIDKFLFVLLVDRELVKSSIISEIRHYFYCLEKKSQQEDILKLKKDKSKSTKKRKKGVSVPMKKFQSAFNQIFKSNLTTFNEIVQELCEIKTKKVLMGKHSMNVVHIRLKQSLFSSHKGSNLSELSAKTQKATIQLIKLIIFLWTIDLSSVFTSKTALNSKRSLKFSEIVLESFLFQVVYKVPLLGQIISHYNCLPYYQSLVKSPDLKMRVSGMERMTLVTFIFRILVFYKPSLFKYLWTFINDSHVLFKIKKDLRPLSHGFRASILREYTSIGLQLSTNLEKSSVNQLENLLRLRNYSTVTIQLCKHFGCMRSLLGKKFDSITKNSYKKLYLSKLDQTDTLLDLAPKSDKNNLFLGVVAFSLLYKYSTIFSAKKKKLGEISEFRFAGVKQGPATTLLILQSPGSLALKWQVFKKEIADLVTYKGQEDKIHFGEPSVLLSLIANPDHMFGEFQNRLAANSRRRDRRVYRSPYRLRGRRVGGNQFGTETQENMRADYSSTSSSSTSNMDERNEVEFLITEEDGQYYNHGIQEQRLESYEAELGMQVSNLNDLGYSRQSIPQDSQISGAFGNHNIQGSRELGHMHPQMEPFIPIQGSYYQPGDQNEEDDLQLEYRGEQGDSEGWVDDGEPSEELSTSYYNAGNQMIDPLVGTVVSRNNQGNSEQRVTSQSTESNNLLGGQNLLGSNRQEEPRGDTASYVITSEDVNERLVIGEDRVNTEVEIVETMEGYPFSKTSRVNPSNLRNPFIKDRHRDQMEFYLKQKVRSSLEKLKGVSEITEIVQFILEDYTQNGHDFNIIRGGMDDHLENEDENGIIYRTEENDFLSRGRNSRQRSRRLPPQFREMLAEVEMESNSMTSDMPNLLQQRRRRIPERTQESMELFEYEVEEGDGYEINDELQEEETEEQTLFMQRFGRSQQQMYMEYLDDDSVESPLRNNEFYRNQTHLGVRHQPRIRQDFESVNAIDLFGGAQPRIDPNSIPRQILFRNTSSPSNNGNDSLPRITPPNGLFQPHISTGDTHNGNTDSDNQGTGTSSNQRTGHTTQQGSSSNTSSGPRANDNNFQTPTATTNNTGNDGELTNEFIIQERPYDDNEEESVRNHSAQMPSHRSPITERSSPLEPRSLQQERQHSGTTHSRMEPITEENQNEDGLPNLGANSNKGSEEDFSDIPRLSNPDGNQSNESGPIDPQNQGELSQNNADEQIDSNPNPEVVLNEQDQAQTSHQNAMNPHPNINFNFGSLGLPNNFLEQAGIDAEFFSGLPYDLQMDVIYQHINQGLTLRNFSNSNQNSEPQSSRNSHNNSIINDSTVQILSNRSPAEELNLPALVPEQPNNTHAHTGNTTHAPSPNNEENNVNMEFINNLDPETRLDVLLTCSEEYLNTLTEQVRQEARQRREEFSMQDPRLEALLTDLQHEQAGMQSSLQNRQNIIEQRLSRRYFQNMVNRTLTSKKSPKKIIPLKPLASHVNIISDQEVKILIELLSGNVEYNIPSFEILAACCGNIISQSKIIGSLLYTLVNFNLIHESCELDSGSKLSERTNSRKKYEKNVISRFENLLKTLYLLVEDFSKVLVSYLSNDINSIEEIESHLQQGILKQDNFSKNLKKPSLSNLILLVTKGVKIKLKDTLIKVDLSSYASSLILKIIEIASKQYLADNKEEDSGSKQTTSKINKIQNVFQDTITEENCDDDDDQEEEKEMVEDSEKKQIEKVILDTAKSKTLWSLEVNEIEFLCDLFSQSQINSSNSKVLVSIISNFSKNENNLSNFISTFGDCILQIISPIQVKNSKEIEIIDFYQNDQTLQNLKNTINRLKTLKNQNLNEITSNNSETKLVFVFKVILKLYQKGIQHSHRSMKILQEPKMEEETQKFKESQMKQIEEMEKKSRQKFKILFESKALKQFWLDTSESIQKHLQTFSEDKNMKNKNMKTAYCVKEYMINNDKKMLMDNMYKEKQQIFTSFFIMYKILCDDDLAKNYNSSAIRDSFSTDAKNNVNNYFGSMRQPSSSKLKIAKLQEDISQSTNKSIPELDYDSLKSLNLDIEDLMMVICEKNKKFINYLVIQKPNLLLDQLSTIPKV